MLLSGTKTEHLPAVDKKRQQANKTNRAGPKLELKARTFYERQP